MLLAFLVLAFSLVDGQAQLSSARSNLCAASTSTVALFCGGSPSGGAVSNVCDMYNGAAWSTSAFSVARSDCAGAATATKAFFAGGANAAGNPLNTVDIYDRYFMGTACAGCNPQG
jgi:hypothetical protein